MQDSSLLGEMADSRTGAGKVQGESGTSCYAKKKKNKTKTKPSQNDKDVSEEHRSQMNGVGLWELAHLGTTVHQNE